MQNSTDKVCSYNRRLPTLSASSFQCWKVSRFQLYLQVAFSVGKSQGASQLYNLSQYTKTQRIESYLAMTCIGVQVYCGASVCCREMYPSMRIWSHNSKQTIQISSNAGMDEIENRQCNVSPCNVSQCTVSQCAWIDSSWPASPQEAIQQRPKYAPENRLSVTIGPPSDTAGHVGQQIM